MGVDTKITLPGDVRLRDVADVVGICAGLTPVQKSLGSDGDAWYTDVPGVSTESCDSIAECASVHLSGPMIDGSDRHHFLYHFEWGAGGGRGIMPRSTPFWIAIGIKLVNFFGGEIDYADCDDRDVDYSAGKPRETNSPEEGKPWQEMQEAIFGVRMITAEEYAQATQYAAYSDYDECGAYRALKTEGVKIHV